MDGEHPQATTHKGECRKQYTRERGRRNNRAWREANPDKEVARKKAYHEANRERCIAKAKKWHEENRERYLDQKKKYREANRAHIAEYEAALYWSKTRPDGERIDAIMQQATPRQRQRLADWLLGRNHRACRQHTVDQWLMEYNSLENGQIT